MENFLLLLATSFVLQRSSPRRLRNHFIGNTGCSALLLSNSKFDSCITCYGDQLHCTSFSEKGVTFGIICVQLNKQYEMKEAVQLLKNYINKLRSPFSILHNTGLHKVVDWNSPASRVLVDYWQDNKGKDWKVKGYTNGNVMAFLYVKNIGHAETKKQELFLDNFHFKMAD